MTYRALGKCNGSGKRKEVRLVCLVVVIVEVSNRCFSACLTHIEFSLSFVYQHHPNRNITDKKKKKIYNMLQNLNDDMKLLTLS